MATTKTLFTFLASLVLSSLLLACSSNDPASRADDQATAFADLRAAIAETIADENRQADVLNIVGALEADVDELRALLVRRREKVRALNADYDATREEFLELSRQMEARIQASKRRAVERQQALGSAMTAEEWDSLAKVQTRAMKAIAQSVQGI